jgi:hypothetical protein
VSALFAPALRCLAGRRDLQVRRGLGQARRGFSRHAALRRAPHWQAALTAVWRVAAQSEQASARISSQPAAVHSLMATAAARRLAGQAASEPLVASPASAQVRPAARLEALRAAEEPRASGARQPAARRAEEVAVPDVRLRAEAAPSSAVLREAGGQAAQARWEAFGDSELRAEAGLFVVVRPRSVLRVRKPARVGPARIARTTAAASATRW